MTLAQEQFNKIDSLLSYLIHHPDQEMIQKHCEGYLGIDSSLYYIHEGSSSEELADLHGKRLKVSMYKEEVIGGVRMVPYTYGQWNDIGRTGMVPLACLYRKGKFVFKDNTPVWLRLHDKNSCFYRESDRKFNDHTKRYKVVFDDVTAYIPCNNIINQ